MNTRGAIAALGFWAAFALGGQARTGENGQDLWLEGRVVPLQATTFLAPQNEVDGGGLRVRSRTALLTELVPEGKVVRAGERLAVFVAPEALLRERVDQEIRLVEAEAARETGKLAVRLQELEQRLAIAKQDEKVAQLETKKKEVLSQRDSELVELAAREAAFEVQALLQQIAAQQEVLRTTRAFHDERVRQARLAVSALEESLARYRPAAPHAGRVWYPRLPDKGRKPRVQDRLPGGLEFLWLAKDERVAVEWLVPESSLANTPVGKPVTIKRLPDGLAAQGRVVAVGKLPVDAQDAGEKHFLVRAEFVGAAAKFSPGLAVRVEP